MSFGELPRGEDHQRRGSHQHGNREGAGREVGGPGFQRSWLLGLSCLLSFFFLSLVGLSCMISFWFSLPTEPSYSTDELCGLKYWG